MPPARRSQNLALKTPLKKTPARPKPAPKPVMKPVVPVKPPRRIRPTQSEEREAQEEATQLEGREDFSPSLVAELQRAKRARNAIANEVLATDLNESRAIDAEAKRL